LTYSFVLSFVLLFFCFCVSLTISRLEIMRLIQVMVTLLAAASFLLPASAQTAARKQYQQSLDKAQSYSQALPPGSVGLPACIHGPAVGQPGDNVSRGQFNSGGNYSQSARNSAVGLPQCRNSPYMGEPGDNIRSDLGRQISGQAARGAAQSRAATVGLPQCRNSPYMGEPGDNIRGDLGHHISGASIQKRQNSRLQATPQASSQPTVYTRAYTYNDYTH
jgi:hypothetical protein